MEQGMRKTHILPAVSAAIALLVSASSIAGVAPAGPAAPAGGSLAGSGHAGGTIAAPNGIPGEVPPIAGQTSLAGGSLAGGGLAVGSSAPRGKKSDVVTVQQPNVQPTVGKPESSTEVWEQAIQAPPEGKISKLSKQAAEEALMQAYQAGRLRNLPPIVGTNGEILYAYGQSYPTLVTAPLHTSIIVLQRGMQDPKGVGLSPAYWQTNTLMVGNQPELAITPRFAGLHGNLIITGTSPSGKPMNYPIEVVSDKNRYTPMVGFYYPEDILIRWQASAKRQANFQKKVQAETVAVLPSIDPSDLDFRWKMRCAGGGWFSNSDCRSILPERVFDDGKQTFIQFRPGQGSHGGIPSILAENAAGQNAIVNTTFRDGYYIVDGVPPKILLIAGKGDSGKVVKIVHEGH
jgi:type IV secretory pathway VirB9-like protein